MPDTRLKRIAIRNWESVRESVVEFPEKGLVFVHGINAAAEGKLKSIGSGKTALGEALSIALLGVTGRFSQMGHYSYKSKGDSLVVVECTHKDKPLIVELGVKAPELNKTGEALRYTYDGQQVWRDRIGNTRDDLIKLITVPPDLAEWTVYMNGDQLHFDSLSQRKSVELLMSALAQPPWTEYLAKANQTVTNLGRDLKNAVQNHENLQAALQRAEADLEMASTRLTEAENVYEKQLAENAQALKSVNATLKELGDKHQANVQEMNKIKLEINRRVQVNAEAEHQAEIKRNECQDAWALAKDAYTDLLVDQRQAQTELNQAQESLRKIQNAPKTCPTCGQAWEQDHAHANLQESQKDAKAAEIRFKAVAASVAKQKNLVTEASEALRLANDHLAEVKAQAPIDELSGQYEALEHANGRLSRQINEAERTKSGLERGPDRSAVTRAEATVEERTRQRALSQKAVEDSASKLAEDDEGLRIAEYWQEAFGPNGIPNMILKDAIAPLNAASRRVSTLMSGGCIRVRYDTSRELASGRDKAELNIMVDNPEGSDRADGGSKGESGLTNLIVAETLAEVGGVANRVGFRWYDEVVANQDESVRRSFFAYLKEVARRYGILVFVVSHAPEAASYADYVLIAEKTKQHGTTYRWG